MRRRKIYHLLGITSLCWGVLSLGTDSAYAQYIQDGGKGFNMITIEDGTNHGQASISGTFEGGVIKYVEDFRADYNGPVGGRSARALYLVYSPTNLMVRSADDSTFEAGNRFLRVMGGL